MDVSRYWKGILTLPALILGALAAFGLIPDNMVTPTAAGMVAVLNTALVVFGPKNTASSSVSGKIGGGYS